MIVWLLGILKQSKRPYQNYSLQLIMCHILGSYDREPNTPLLFRDGGDP